MPTLHLEPPDNLEELWESLLVETLPPDKRDTLQAQWQATASVDDRYMMFLEYSSYLRRKEPTTQEKKQRREQLRPFFESHGIDRLPGDEEGERTMSMAVPCVRAEIVVSVVPATSRAVRGQ